MEPQKNLTLILFVSLSLIFLNPTEAICRPKNSAGKLVPGHDDHAKSPVPIPKATPKVTLPPPAPVSSQPPPKATPPPQQVARTPLPNVVLAKLKMLCTQVTSYPDLCVTTFTQYLTANSNLDDQMFLFKTAVQIVIKETGLLKDLTTSYIAKASSPVMASNLRACQGDFDDALEDIQTAMSAVPSKDYGTIGSFLSSVIDDYADCDDEFTGLNPLAVQTKRLSALVDNSLAFSQKIQWT